MKIRLGFVSNSSSSSFALLGIRLEWDNEQEMFDKVEKLMNKGKDIVGMGSYMDEGRDIFDLNPIVFNLLKKNWHKIDEDTRNEFTFWIKLVEGGESSGFIPASKLRAMLSGMQQGVVLYSDTAAYGSSVDKQTFTQNYFYDKEDQVVE